MKKIILLSLAAIIVTLVIVISLQPSSFKVVRKTTVNAPPAAVFSRVNDFHQWEAWSPWAKKDPSMKQTYEGPASGVGAVYKWDGNSDVGQGMMTLTGSNPPDSIGIKLEFIKPFAGTNDVSFTFQPQDTQTVVTWTMEGKSTFMTKAVGLFMNMDKMIGDDFEKGLSSLKALSETPSSPPSPPGA